MVANRTPMDFKGAGLGGMAAGVVGLVEHHEYKLKIVFRALRGTSIPGQSYASVRVYMHDVGAYLQVGLSPWPINKL